MKLSKYIGWTFALGVLIMGGLLVAWGVSLVVEHAKIRAREARRRVQVQALEVAARELKNKKTAVSRAKTSQQRAKSKVRRAKVEVNHWRLRVKNAETGLIWAETGLAKALKGSNSYSRAWLKDAKRKVARRKTALARNRVGHSKAARKVCQVEVEVDRACAIVRIAEAELETAKIRLAKLKDF